MAQPTPRATIAMRAGLLPISKRLLEGQTGVGEGGVDLAADELLAGVTQEGQICQRRDDVAAGPGCAARDGQDEGIVDEREDGQIAAFGPGSGRDRELEFSGHQPVEDLVAGRGDELQARPGEAFGQDGGQAGGQVVVEIVDETDAELVEMAEIHHRELALRLAQFGQCAFGPDEENCARQR